MKITETLAIHRYIAEKWKPELCGKDPADRARVTMLSKHLYDLKMGITGPCYRGTKEQVMECSNKIVPTLINYLGDS